MSVGFEVGAGVGVSVGAVVGSLEGSWVVADVLAAGSCVGTVVVLLLSHPAKSNKHTNKQVPVKSFFIILNISLSLMDISVIENAFLIIPQVGPLENVLQ